MEEATSTRYNVTHEVAMIYGLLDTETKFWLGDRMGPRLYDNECRSPQG
jgi:hypothetical protein